MHPAHLAQSLWHQLWHQYRDRVEYARIYQQMIEAVGGQIANDHIAFRSLRLTLKTTEGSKNLGIAYLEPIIQALGYHAVGEYEFPDQHLYARHYQHPEQAEFDLPKLFISELIVDELPAEIGNLIQETVRSADFPAIDALISQITEASTDELDLTLINQLYPLFSRPWQPPQQSVVETVNRVSQYGAWVLIHGYAVNHFTGYINRQQTPQYPDIERTAQGLAEQGVPMKAGIEGSRGSGLRQTATRAVQELVTVQDDTGQWIQIPWTYAYYEIAERNAIEVAPGEMHLFEGFLGPQARNLFEMTRKV